MTTPLDPGLDNCGCCEPEPVQPPIYNRPGLPALAYRAGTYATFFRRMLSRISTFTLQDGDFSGSRPLANLATRSQDDPSIALMDASSVMADVLTFYQERLANEGFLRTAVERNSILELAREIGYELNPGVAATVFLAFTVEDAPGAPGMASVPAGTRVKSIPPQGKLPQTFETSTAVTVHKGWNALLPRLSQEQNLLSGIGELYLKGTGSNLKTGDVVFISNTYDYAAAHVDQVDIDSTDQITHVTFDRTTASLGGMPISMTAIAYGDKVPFNADAINQEILQKTWEDDKLNAFLQANGWDAQALMDSLALYRQEKPAVNGLAYTLRTRLGIFGNNAVKYDSLPTSQRFGEWINDSSNTAQFKAGAYPATWENRDITTDSQGTALSTANFYLEHSVPAVQAGDYAVLEKAGSFGVYPVTSVLETSLSDYGISLKVTGLNVSTPFSSPALDSFPVRTTTAYVQSELLAPSGLPLAAQLEKGASSLELDSFIFGLQVGQAVLFTGERADADGQVVTEPLIIKSISHNYGLTTLVFETGLSYPYKRSTASLNANVAIATHGETVSEPLGSGDGSQVHQKFTLKKPPLTYTPAPSPSGGASTLQLRVNNLLWDEAASLYGLAPNDQDYIIRIDNDGKATVIFGDGLKGGRLPTGLNNVTAVYRSGIGLDGQVDAGSLTLLSTRPLGVRGVTNPLAASGAADPEKMEKARGNAPLTVRTLDRIVSRDDYEDFARAFAGIGKAQAIDLWNNGNHIVHLTVAAADGTPITDVKFQKNFMAALDAARDPAQLVKVDTFTRLLFNLVANIAVDRRYIATVVLNAVQTALIGAFAFAERSFGQPVTSAEVITVMQKVDGVVYVDLTALYLSKQSPALNQILSSSIAHGFGGTVQPAELLLINPYGITLQEVSA